MDITFLYTLQIFPVHNHKKAEFKLMQHVSKLGIAVSPPFTLEFVRMEAVFIHYLPGDKVKMLNQYSL